ncbi:MAG: hypothetical protein EOP49_09360 [Sphingobacteriales bacterium]|nr:MAG: hypothetical protein EOP49_09360 [Sphingobacteriales bacterium]
MAKYRVEFDNKEIKSIERAENTTPEHDTFLEERTGETIWATVEADTDEEAREKASRLAVELQTGQTKRDLTGGAQDAREDKGPRE